MTNWADEIRTKPKPNITQPETGDWSQQLKQPKRNPNGITGSWNEDLTWGETLLTATKNAPQSAVRYGKAIYDTISHPVRTAQSMVGLAEKGAQALAMQEPSNPYEIGKSFRFAEKGMQELQPLVDEMKSRYGSIDNFKQSFAQDPAFVLADISALLIPAGKLTGLKAIEKFGGSLEPINMMKNAMALPFKLIPEKYPAHLYKSAVKFSTVASRDKLDRIVKTALTEKIMPTSKGLVRLRNKINNYNSQVNELLNNIEKSGYKLDIRNVYKGLDKIKDELKLLTDEPLKYETALKGIKKQLKEQLKMGTLRTPKQIQAVKQTIYRELQGFYNKIKAEPAKVELRKATARNARKMLENIIPEIKKLNKDEGALLDLYGELEQKANRISNRDLIGIGLPVKMGTGSGVGYMFGGETGGKVGSMLGFALGVFDTPQIKSKIAIVLDTMSKKGITYKITPTLGRILAAEEGKEE